MVGITNYKNTEYALHYCTYRYKTRGKEKFRDDDHIMQFSLVRERTTINSTRVCLPRSKRQASNGDACKLKQTKNKTTCACIPRSKRQTSNGEACSNASRRKTNLHVHVYPVLASDEQSDEQWRHMHVYLVLSVRRAMETLN